MLDRAVVKEFIDNQFDGTDMKIPNNVSKSELIETFCRYVEDDYYEWLKDNFQSFFDHGSPDWKWIRSRIKSFS